MPLFPHQKNDDNLEAVFSRFLAPAVGPDLAKSSQNTVRVCKNRGPPFSPETVFFYKNLPEMATLGTPRNSKNPTKRQKRAIRNGAEKKTKKKLKYKPVLAREREARFYFGALADQLACIVEKLEERIQDFLNSSPTPSSRAIVYCTILCSAVLY